MRQTGNATALEINVTWAAHLLTRQAHLLRVHFVNETDFPQRVHDQTVSLQGFTAINAPASGNHSSRRL
jgi:hypothetical protein